MAPLNRQLVLPVLCCVLACLLAGCGSGFAALFSGDSHSSSSEPDEPDPPPTLIATRGAFAPLANVGTPLMSVRLQDVPKPDHSATILVEIRALNGTAVDRPFSVYRAADDAVDFFYDIPNIRGELIAKFGQSNAFGFDVPAELAVTINGVDAAPAVPITLLSRPIATVEDPSAIILVSAAGTDTVKVKLRSVVLDLPTSGVPGSLAYTTALIERNSLQVTVAFGDLAHLSPEQPAVIQSVTPAALLGEYEIDFIMPRTDDPTQAQFTVDSFPSGRSSLVSRVFCRPVLFGTSPSTGSTDGGTEVALFGHALIPSDKQTGEMQFEKIKLRARKGGRISEIPLEKIRRDLSKQNQLVFSMPASPDGTPGPVSLELLVTVGANPPPHQSATEDLTVTKMSAFIYGATYPNFGPRGVGLLSNPIVVRVAPFVSRTVKTVDALALSSGPNGLPYVGLYSNRGNGMFVRFGDRVRAGNPEDLAQRYPTDLSIGQFTASGSPSAAIINRANGLAARHSLVLGNNLTNPPLRFFESLPVKEAGIRCKGGYLNSDKIQDLVVLGNFDDDRSPALYISGRPSNGGGFTRTLLAAKGKKYGFTALEIADLDRDGYSDIVFAQAGESPRVLIAYGDSRGTFSVSNMIEPGFDLAAAGYRLDKASTIVDIHAVGSILEPALAFVISGARGQLATPPTVAFLERGSQARTFMSLGSANLLTFPDENRLFVASVAGDLDLTGTGSRELVVAATGDLEKPLWVFVHDSRGMREIKNAADIGVEQIHAIKSIDYGLATANGMHHQDVDRPAIFVAHDVEFRGRVEHRISTFFTVPGKTPALISPSPARQIEEWVLEVIVGEFRERSGAENVGQSSDAWAVVASGLRLLYNDGLGEISLSGRTISPPKGTILVPESLTRVSAGHSSGGLDAPCVLTENGRIGVVLPSNTAKIIWAGGSEPIDLRALAPYEYLRKRSVKPESSIQSQDLDGDGVEDLVVLLNLSKEKGRALEDESILLFLRGIPEPSQGEFPYELTLPSVNTPNGLTHGNATSMVLGDFAIQSTSPNPLEIAVAIPVGTSGGGMGGNHVRVYRFKPSTKEIVRTSTDPSNTVWVSGSMPTLLLAADYNGDGRTDLAVASGDSKLRVLYNFSPRRGASGFDVDLGAFQGAPANPIPFVGEPLEMLGGDLNGDSVSDVVLMTLSDSGSMRDQHVLFFLGPGKLGGVSSSGVVPPERTGNLLRDGSSWGLRNGSARIALGDLNGDGAPDLLIGWQSLNKDDYNLRVLFGNSF